MKPNILRSRKFWLAVSDAVVTLALLYGTFFLPETYHELLQVSIVTIGGVVAVLIAAIAYEDAAAMKSGKNQF